MAANGSVLLIEDEREIADLLRLYFERRGLGIVDELEHVLGGSIAVDSLSGSGTTVSVRLPYRGDRVPPRHS